MTEGGLTDRVGREDKEEKEEQNKRKSWSRLTNQEGSRDQKGKEEEEHYLSQPYRVKGFCWAAMGKVDKHRALLS